jgi:uncharacterized membrane protein
MNLHVVVVHFPVALLTCYALLELGSVWSRLRTEFWTKVKALAITVGTFSSYASFLTGDAIEHDFPGQLVETHAFFAALTVGFFTLLTLMSLLRLLFLANQLPPVLQSIGRTSKTLLDGPIFAATIGLVSLFLITVTGALGGALAYGPDVDPIVKIVYHLFVQ